jgi:GTPase
MDGKRQKQFLLISIIPKLFSDQEALNDLLELKSLIKTYGGSVVDLVVQRREVHDKGSFVGIGKIQEAAAIMTQKKIDVVVLNGHVKPGQIYEMKSIFMKRNKYIKVWDRNDLILQIFAKHAHTSEARLQIELAAMRHMGPRIYGMGMELSQQTGGIGTRGVGETNTELMKRHWREQMKNVTDKLNKLAGDRSRQLERRKRAGLATISIIGYTNAGKTSLFNKLTKKKKTIGNALFITLDSVVGKVYLPKTQKEILISDTIGFIRNLPMELIDAFKSTLLESMNADIVLHVIDASDREIHLKIAVVENILSDLNLQDRKRIYVFNKIDAINGLNLIDLKEQYQTFPAYFVSVKNSENISALLEAIECELMPNAS